jgi:dCMP deaminase
MAGRAQRPSWDEYYMTIARAVATRSNCIRRSVGALIVVDNAIIAAGYNGTPMGVQNCCDGGCPRCASDVAPGEGYDSCVCVHAEQNAIVLAARHGNATHGGTLYSTLRPCFGCAKESIQAGIAEVVFGEPYEYESDLEDVYRRLIAESGMRLRQHPWPGRAAGA